MIFIFHRILYIQSFSSAPEAGLKGKFSGALKNINEFSFRHQRILHASVVDEDIESETDYSSFAFRKRAVIEGFVHRMGGKRTIQRILIANNGMAATKAILSIRQWAYMMFGDERAIEFVAMATRDDLNANAEFIRLADTFVEVPSGSNKV